ncbi:MAG TPA: hypothetical protein PK082_01505 [Phycisphaerae bacterium]|nr:hypothetical protein [Phycisphaerae bacterium]
MSETGMPPSPKPAKPFGFAWDRGTKHFVVACVLLAVAALGWRFAVGGLKVALRKEAVPWPALVRVNEQTFQLESLPESLGEYRFVQADGELFYNDKGEPLYDGKPDGEITLETDVMETLGVGSSLDASRVKTRTSNWYLSRIYRKGPAPSSAYERKPFQYWQLDLTYYTGGIDTVPHVPERCLVASGARLIGGADVTFEVPMLPAPWDGPLVFRQTRYEVWDDATLTAKLYVQYYIFSYNGRPENDWRRVRLDLANPWSARHCYFAKVQFLPRNEILNLQDADRAAEEFVRNVLPSILQQFPMPKEIEELDARPQG